MSEHPSQPQPGHAAAKRSAVRRWLESPIAVCLLLAGLTLALYFPVTHHDFVNFDDPEYVTKNPRVQAGLTFDGVRWAFGTWHPLTWLSLMLDVSLFGLGPRGFHLVNLLWHVGNTVLAFLLFRKMTGAFWRSALVAALFAWHPVQVESVAWISERKGVLSTFFGLLTLWTYAGYVGRVRCQVSGETPVVSRGTRHAARYYWLALVFFILALMSKPILVTLPCLMLLLDYWPLNRLKPGDRILALKTWLPLIREKIPFLVLSVISSVATAMFQKEAGALQTLGGYSASSRIENAFVGYAHYLGKIFWPTSLATPYPRIFHWPPTVVALALLLTIGLCVAAIWLGRRRPFVLTGWFWFFGMLLPVIGLIQVGAAAVADRYLYLPALGLFILLVWGVSEAVSRRKIPKSAIALAAMLVLTASALQTRDQLRHWQNSETLFQHAIAVTKENWIAHYCLGLYCEERGRTDEAFQHYRRTAEIKPNYAEAWHSLGLLLADRKDFAQAAPSFESAMLARPDVTEYRYNFARALGILGKADEAIAQYRQVLQQNPGMATAQYDLAVLLAKTGKPGEAIAHFRETLRLQPNNPLAHYHLGRIISAGGNPAEAIEHFRAALKLYPDFAQAREALRALGVNDN